MSWVVGFDGRVMGNVDDDTYQFLKFSQTAIVVVKGSVRS